MLQAFVFPEVAILVRHWFEVSLKDGHLEHGVRLELRLRDPQPQRGSVAAAQKILVDQPVWRADLFDRVDGLPGGFEAAHFHPYFDGVEPCKRHWADEVKDAPWDWLHGRLSDIADVAATGGVRLRDPAAESEHVRADADVIVVAAQSRAALRCRSKEQCHAWTQDVAPTVRRMLGEVARPNLIDQDRVSPWLRHDGVPSGP